MEGRKFDLNIEKILENWQVYDALREIISNAIDEEILTRTKPPHIFKNEDGRWHVRDFGRGLKYEHLTQNESQEKLKNPHVIGKFGIGLKDALATFDRKKVKVLIKSPHGDITFGKSEKHGFENLVTLHAYIRPTSNPKFVGTEFVLDGCTDEDVSRAKDLFLRFSREKVVERTVDGEVIQRKEDVARIYVNGVRVAQEENFLFSYNITSVTKAIRKALNRERTNVGRTAYTDRVKSILLSSESKQVASLLVEDLKGYENGTLHDELKWTDVSVHACSLLNSLDKVVFLTPSEILQAANMVDKARADGYRIVIIPLSIKAKIRGLKDVSGSPIRDLEQFQEEWDRSFQFKFVSEKDLTTPEREVFRMTDRILALAGGKPTTVKAIKISETMRIDPRSFREAEGLWEPASRRIIIKRSSLGSLEKYAATLLHELCHVTSGASDISNAFEQELTSLIGNISAKALSGKRPRP